MLGSLVNSIFVGAIVSYNKYTLENKIDLIDRKIDKLPYKNKEIWN